MRRQKRDTQTATQSADDRDCGSFDALYAAHAPRVCGFLRQLTGDPAAADDLTQETFVAAWVGRAGFAGRSKPLSWLLGIAARRWRDKRRHAHDDSVALTDEIEDRTAVSPETTAVRRLDLNAALSTLDPNLREALLLVAGQQMTYAEAAAILDAPEGTIKWRVHKAVAAMRVQLAEEALTTDVKAHTKEHDDGLRTHSPDTHRSGRR